MKIIIKFSVALLCSLFVGFLLLLCGIKNPARAQTPPEIAVSTSTPNQPTVEEVFEFRNKILDLFNIPHDVPLTLYDIMNGKIEGRDLPHPTGTSSISRVLSDLEIVLDKNEFIPGAKIQAIAVAFSTNLQNASVRWYYNDKLVESGKGKAFFAFTLGPAGSTNTIKVAITAETGEYKELVKTIHPATIHMIWSSNTYTPAWYRGKALPSGKSQATVYAIPDFYIGGAKLDPSTLIYEWSADGGTPTTDPAISGIGKNSFILNLSTVPGKTYSVSVRIHDAQKRIITENSILVESVQPQIELYAVDPLYGVGASLSSNINTIKSGAAISIIAEPYYIPQFDFGGLTYDWRVNNNKVSTTASTAQKLRIDAPNGTSGQQTISIFYSNPLNVFTRGSGNAVINIQ